VSITIQNHEQIQPSITTKINPTRRTDRQRRKGREIFASSITTQYNTHIHHNPTHNHTQKFNITTTNDALSTQPHDADEGGD
jgi:hypothetical protein